MEVLPINPCSLNLRLDWAAKLGLTGLHVAAAVGDTLSVEDTPVLGASNPVRDASTICVVEEPKDIQVIERTGEYNGRYHVLGGALDPRQAGVKTRR